MKYMQTRRDLIIEYLKNVDWNSDWSYKKIKSDLKNTLGEEPAIDVNYKKDAILNEFNSETKEVLKVDTIDVIYSPNLDEEVKRVKIKIDNN
jgi:hypothetical protein